MSSRIGDLAQKDDSGESILSQHELQEERLRLRGLVIRPSLQLRQHGDASFARVKEQQRVLKLTLAEGLRLRDIQRAIDSDVGEPVTCCKQREVCEHCAADWGHCSAKRRVDSEQGDR